MEDIRSCDCGPGYLRSDPTILPALASVVDDYRKIIVLMDGSEALDEATRARCDAAGQVLFWHEHRTLDELTAKFANPSGRRGLIRQLIRYLTSDPSVHDADKLALLDLVGDLASGTPQPDLRGLLDNLQSIQLAYRWEVTAKRSTTRRRGKCGKPWPSNPATLCC